MNNSITTKTLVKNRINELLDFGIKDKTEIFSKIMDEFGISRPDVRRIARDLRNEMMFKVRVLQNEAYELKRIE